MTAYSIIRGVVFFAVFVLLTLWFKQPAIWYVVTWIAIDIARRPA